MNTHVLTGPWPAVLTPQAVAEKTSRSAERMGKAAEALLVELAAMRQRRAASSKSPKLLSGVLAPKQPARVVLLVEDNASVLRVAQRALERAGYIVRTGRSGAEACAQLDTCPDIVVCDLALGEGCSGLSVAREVRRRCPKSLVVLWTGELAGLALQEAQQKSGAHAVSQKGAGVDDLVAAVRSLEVKDVAR